MNFRTHITPTNTLNFLQQLTTLTSAGINIMQSLSILNQAYKKTGLSFVIQSVQRDLETGKELNKCLQKFPHLFDNFSCKLIRIGEHTGTLDIMLKRLVTYQEKTLNLQQQIKQALFYPAIIIITTLTTLIILLFFVVPHFAALFENFPEKIPLFTKAIISISNSLCKIRGSSITFILTLTTLALYFRKSPLFHITIQRHALRVPYLRVVIKKIALAKFVRNLSTILAAAIPLTEALIMVSLITSIKELSISTIKLHADVTAGKSFHASLRLHTFFPPLLIQMTRTGEESGTLEIMLNKYADMLESDIDQSLNALNKLLEPLIIGILGVLIGGIVIAMYLPIFRLGTVI